MGMRHGIVADAGPPGRGVGMAHAVHAAAGATAVRPGASPGAAAGGFTADVIVTFLEAISGAVKAHQNAGYTFLGDVKRNKLPVMYHQECKRGGRPLSEQQVRLYGTSMSNERLAGGAHR